MPKNAKSFQRSGLRLLWSLISTNFEVSNQISMTVICFQVMFLACPYLYLYLTFNANLGSLFLNQLECGSATFQYIFCKTVQKSEHLTLSESFCYTVFLRGVRCHQLMVEVLSLCILNPWSWYVLPSIVSPQWLKVYARFRFQCWNGKFRNLQGINLDL